MQLSRDRMSFTSQAADIVFGGSTPVGGDYSLQAFLRAIVVNYSGEIPEEKQRTLRVIQGRANKECFDGDELMTIVEARDSGITVKGMTGWTCLDGAPTPANKYLSQFVNTTVYVNEELKRVVVFVERRANHVWAQALMSILPRILTWFFPLKLTKEEIELVSSISVENKKITQEEAQKILTDYVNSAAEKIEIRKLAIHKYLNGYADKIRASKMSDIDRIIRNTLNDINNYSNALKERYRTLSDNQSLLRSLKLTPEENQGREIEFFEQHKQITILEVSGDTIKFGVDDTLEFYDEDEIEAVLKNTNSYMYYEADEKIRKVFEAIFVKHKGVFRTNAVFSLTSMRYVDPLKNQSFVADSLPHPHIYFYGCSGGNDQYYSQYAESGEWELAIEQAISAAKNINFGDSTVLEETIDWLKTHPDNRCIYVDDKSKLVSVNEFIKIIDSEEKDG